MKRFTQIAFSLGLAFWVMALAFPNQTLANESWRKEPSIPLPGGTAYVSHGLVGVFAGGKIKDLDESQSLFQWQGELSYFYYPWLSGAAGFRIKAGEPYDTAQKVENRYFLALRAHKAWSKVVVFAGPELGVDNLNLTSSTRPQNDSLAKDVLTKTFSNTGAAVGLELGLGWKPLPWVGLTYGHRLEYSLANLTRESSRASRTFNLRTLPGISFDLLPFLPRLHESVHAFYVFAEYQNGYLLIVDDRRRVEGAWLAGATLAF